MSADPTLPTYPEQPRPPMVCATCGGVLVWPGHTYVHDDKIAEGDHVARPIEPWSDVDARELIRWESWRPPTWEYPPLPGVIINALPPEPPMGTKVAFYHRPDEVIYKRVEGGWIMPEWDELGIVCKPDTWRYVATLFLGHLVVVDR